MDKLTRLRNNMNCFFGVKDFESNLTRDDPRTGAKAKELLEIYPESGTTPIVLDEGTAKELYEYFK